MNQSKLTARAAIGVLTQALIEKNLSNQDIADVARIVFPDAKTTSGSVSVERHLYNHGLRR